MRAMEKLQCAVLTQGLPLLILTLLLSACATVKPPKPPSNEALPWPQRETQLSAISHWTLKGKMGVRLPHHSGSADVVWQQTGQDYTLNLFGPLGLGRVVIEGDPYGVTLKRSSKDIHRAKTPEALLKEQVGWDVPVSNLYYWVRGLPVPQVPAKTQFDYANHLTQLEQAGWTIHYQRYTDVKGIDLPNKLLLSKKSIRIKIIIRQWFL